MHSTDQSITKPAKIEANVLHIPCRQVERMISFKLHSAEEFSMAQSKTKRDTDCIGSADLRLVGSAACGQRN